MAFFPPKGPVKQFQEPRERLTLVAMQTEMIVFFARRLELGQRVLQLLFRLQERLLRTLHKF